MARKDELGRRGERLAERYAQDLGWAVLDRNWRSPTGEIDLVLSEGQWLVIAEVKTRSGEGFGHPFEAIDSRKCARLAALAREWSREHPDDARGRRLRIDAIAVTIGAGTPRIEHLRDIS
jgi:putative endonuclease